MIHKILSKTSNFNPRHWTNLELKKIAHKFRGSFLNLSGANDSDKENSFYKQYFINLSSYHISNYRFKVNPRDLVIDLEKKLNKNLKKRFTTVFSHTVLEHIYNVETAIQNICSLAKCYVITVVPFIQSYHREKMYNDFWRFSPVCLDRMFSAHGFKTLFTSWNETKYGNIYIIHVSCKKNIFKLKFSNGKKMNYGPGYKRDNLIFGKYGRNNLLNYD